MTQWHIPDFYQVVISTQDLLVSKSAVSSSLFRPNGRLRILYFLTPLLLVMGSFEYPSTLLTTWQLFKVLNSFELLNFSMFCGCCYNFIHSMITYQYFYVQKHDSRNLRKVSDLFECCNLGKVSFEHIFWMSFLLPEYTNGSFRKHISFFLLLWNLKRKRERSYEMRVRMLITWKDTECYKGKCSWINVIIMKLIKRG